MRRLIFLTCLFFTAYILVGCSESPTGFRSDAVSAQVVDNGISVLNNLDVSVYYFAVESEHASLINWAAVSTYENEIKSRGKKFIPFSDVGGFEKGKQIIFYHWSTEDTTPSDIHCLVISTDT